MTLVNLIDDYVANIGDLLRDRFRPVMNELKSW